MKTQEETQKHMNTLKELATTERVQWFMAKGNTSDDWKVWNDIEIDVAFTMMNYCFTNRIDFEIEFKKED